MELVFTADTHIANTTWKRTPGVCGDSYRAFDQIVAYCADHKDRVAALVLGGDIFDAKPDSTDVYCFLKGIRLLAKLGVKVMAIQGQHGRDRKLPWTSIDPYVSWLHGANAAELPGPTHITGFDNMPPNELETALKGLSPSVDILVLHQKCKGCLPDMGDQVNWDFDPEWVPKHVKLVLMGDVHKPWETMAGKMRCIYSGSTCMQDIGETPDKSFLVVQLDGTLSIRREPIKNRTFVPFLLHTEVEFALALEKIAKLAPDTLVLVKHDSRISDIERRLAAVNDKVHYLMRLLPLDVEPSTDVTAVEDVPLEKVTLRGCLNSAVDPFKESRLNALLARLLESKDPPVTLAEFKKRVIDGELEPANTGDAAVAVVPPVGEGAPDGKG
jgi:DNA repair exonuclease SbcCD nuclease subunit